MTKKKVKKKNTCNKEAEEASSGKKPMFKRKVKVTLGQPVR